MSECPKWLAAIVYIAIWCAAAPLLAFLALGPELISFDGAFALVIALWLWVIVNLVQVFRGKRRRLWS